MISLVYFVPCKALTTGVLQVMQERKEKEERSGSPALRLASLEIWASGVPLEI